MHPTMQPETIDFLNLLWRGGKWAYLYFIDEERTYTTPEGLTENVKESVWFPVGKLAKLPSKPTAHYYFGVNPTTVKRSERQRAVMDSIASIAALFAEYDVKDWQSKQAILDFIATLRYQPSVLIDSGGGYHAYWLLQEPFIIKDEDDRNWAKSVCRQWVRLCEGDDVKDLTRVLRLPGSRNIKPKYAPDYPTVEYVYCHLDRRYALDDLVSILPLDEDTEKAQNAPKRSEGARAELNGQGSIIDQYNASVAIGDVLERYGYVRRGKRYCAPNADKSVNSSVVILDDNCSYHWDTGDELADEHKHSPFDVYCHFEHNDDPKAAVKAILKDSGKILDVEMIHGVACCPIHHRPLPRANNGNGYKCHAIDKATASGHCDFWWKGDSYSVPDEKPSKVKHEKETQFAERSGTVEYVTDWQSSIVSAAQLQSMTFPELRWVVGGILPEGATLLAGKPKSKKSWFALGLGKAIAMGGKALGSLDVSQGRVLYLDLESSQRRVRSRLNSMAQAREQWPANLHFATEWPRGEEGLHKMGLWMAAYPDTSCMVIDVVEDFRPERDPKANPYSEDRAHIKPINQFAEYHHISVLLLHHTRKAKSEDVFDEISGTTGMVSAVANMLILGRSPENNLESILSLRGRDLINDDPLALKWDTYLCQHIIEGSAAEYAISSERRAILSVMDDSKEYSLKEIAEGVEKSVKAVGNLMNHLLDARLVEKTGYGKYMKVQRNTHGSGGSHGTSGSHGSGGSYRDMSAYDEPTSTEFHQLPPLPFSAHGSLDRSDMPQNGPKNELPSVPWVSKTDCSIDCIKQGDRIVWRLWDDLSNTVIGEYPTEEEAKKAIGVEP